MSPRKKKEIQMDSLQIELSQATELPKVEEVIVDNPSDSSPKVELPKIQVKAIKKKVKAIKKEVKPEKKLKLAPLDFEGYIGHNDQEMYLWLALHLLRIDPSTELKNSLVQYTQSVGDEKLEEYVSFSNKVLEAFERDEKTLLPNLAKFLYSSDITFDKVEDCVLILSRRSDLSIDIVEALEEFKEKCVRLQ